MNSFDFPAGTWQVDATHSVVGFTVRHMMVSKVRGRFGAFSGTVTTSEDGLGSSVEATVDMTSVDTGDANRDQHLRTSDFFDVDNHPTMTFRSTGLVGGGEAYELTGELTIRGVTRQVTFDLEVGGVTTDPWGATRAGFTATASVNRKDFGLEYNAVLEAGGFMIGDKVTIELDVEAVLQTESELVGS